MKKPNPMWPYLGAFLGLFLLSVVGCYTEQTYSSIWQSVYGQIPPYQSELENIKLER